MEPRRIVLGFIGKSGAGKTTIAGKMIEALKKKGIAAVRIGVSDCLREILKKHGLDATRANLQELGQSLCADNRDAVSSLVSEAIAKSDAEIIIFDLLRTEADLSVLCRFKPHFLICVTTDDDKRFKRMRFRNKKGEGSKSDEEFRRAEEHPIESRILELSSVADFTVQNNGTLDDLSQKVTDIMMVINAIKLAP